MTIKQKRNLFWGYIFSIFVTSQGFSQEQGQESLGFSPAPLSAEMLTSLAGQCRQTVNDLWQERPGVPREQLRNFDIAVGDALEKCEALKKIYDQLLVSSSLEKEYHQALETAKNLAAGVNSPPSPLRQ